MTNTRHRTVYENGIEPRPQMNPLRCCCSFLLFLIGSCCIVTGAILIAGEGLFMSGVVPTIIGVSMVVAGLVTCCKDPPKESTETPVAGATEDAATAPIQQHPFLEQHANRSSYIMETNLTDVIYHGQPAVPAGYSASQPQTGTSYPDDVDPNCPPPPFSDSFAYPLKSASQRSEPAPPSYEEALYT